MKKTYIAPALQENETEVVNLMAVSLQSGKASASEEVLSKETEDADWTIWE